MSFFTIEIQAQVNILTMTWDVVQCLGPIMSSY